MMLKSQGSLPTPGSIPSGQNKGRKLKIFTARLSGPWYDLYS